MAAMCVICHRTSADPDLDLCDECTDEHAKTEVDGLNLARSIAWAAKRAWLFASAEIEAARNAMRYAAGAPGDPGPSRHRMRKRR